LSHYYDYNNHHHNNDTHDDVNDNDTHDDVNHNYTNNIDIDYSYYHYNSNDDICLFGGNVKRADLIIRQGSTLYWDFFEQSLYNTSLFHSSASIVYYDDYLNDNFNTNHFDEHNNDCDYTDDNINSDNYTHHVDINDEHDDEHNDHCYYNYAFMCRYMIRTGGTYTMTVDISVFGCRMPITVESSSYILYQTTYGGPFSPNLPSASQSATGVSDPLCFTPPTGMMLTGVRISPQQLKSAFSSDTAFRAYITIKACFTPLNNTCLTTPTTTTTTHNYNTHNNHNNYTDNVDHYHYNYSDKYKYYNICPVVNGLSSPVYLPQFTITGATFDGATGWNIPVSSGGYIAIDLTARGCRGALTVYQHNNKHNKTDHNFNNYNANNNSYNNSNNHNANNHNANYSTNLCIAGNVFNAQILIREPTSDKLVPDFNTPGKTSSTGDPLCYDLNRLTSELMIVPQATKPGYNSTEYQFFVSLMACINPLNSTCLTTPTTTTSTSTTSTTTTTTTPTTPTTVTTSTTTTTPTTSTTTTTPTTSTTTSTTTRTTLTTTLETTTSCAIDGFYQSNLIPSFAVTGGEYDPFYGYRLPLKNGSLEIDLTVNSCRPPIVVDRICLIGNVREANLLFARLSTEKYSPDLSASSISVDTTSPWCYTVLNKETVAKIAIVPLRLKSFSTDSMFNFFVCLIGGNVKRADLIYQTSASQSYLPLVQSTTIIQDGPGLLCYDLNFNVSSIIIAPKELKSSAATGSSTYNFFLSVYGCFMPIPGCTPTTSTRTSTSATTSSTTTSSSSTAKTPTTVTTWFDDYADPNSWRYKQLANYAFETIMKSSRSTSLYGELQNAVNLQFKSGSVVISGNLVVRDTSTNTAASIIELLTKGLKATDLGGVIIDNIGSSAVTSLTSTSSTTTAVESTTRAAATTAAASAGTATSGGPEAVSQDYTILIILVAVIGGLFLLVLVIFIIVYAVQTRRLRDELNLKTNYRIEEPYGPGLSSTTQWTAPAPIGRTATPPEGPGRGLAGHWPDSADRNTLDST
uniref:ZP domain-containing protein n=1 Tax=Macrostomum lignano TaxID=282301 RepID=A0A1I8G185_9PLAT